MIHLTSSPAQIKDGLTGSLSLRCSLNDTAPSAGLIGKRDVTMTTDNVDEVTSILIMRNGQDVAAVSHKHPAAILDGIAVAVNGEVKGEPGERGHLTVSLVNPGHNESGEYVCEINAITWTGHSVKFTQTLEVTLVTPTVEDLVHYVRNQQNMIQNQQSTINNQQSTIQSLTSSVTSLQTSVQELQHIETGTIQCGDSKHWSSIGGGWFQSPQSATFTSTYSRAPVVTLSVIEVDKGTHDAFWYYVELQNVSAGGFNFRCKSKNYPTYHVWHFSVTWTSFGH